MALGKEIIHMPRTSEHHRRGDQKIIRTRGQGRMVWKDFLHRTLFCVNSLLYNSKLYFFLFSWIHVVSYQDLCCSASESLLSFMWHAMINLPRCVYNFLSIMVSEILSRESWTQEKRELLARNVQMLDIVRVLGYHCIVKSSLFSLVIYSLLSAFTLTSILLRDITILFISSLHH